MKGPIKGGRAMKKGYIQKGQHLFASIYASVNHNFYLALGLFVKKRSFWKLISKSSYTEKKLS